MASTDDSQLDFFASQVKMKKKKKRFFVTSSAPHPSRKLEFPNLVLFKWGGNIDVPFELLPSKDIDPIDYDEKWFTTFLSPNSRFKKRELDNYPGCWISIFAKIEKSKKFKPMTLNLINLICWSYLIFFKEFPMSARIFSFES